jgi:hypothetical protein
MEYSRCWRFGITTALSGAASQMTITGTNRTRGVHSSALVRPSWSLVWLFGAPEGRQEISPGQRSVATDALGKHAPSNLPFLLVWRASRLAKPAKKENLDFAHSTLRSRKNATDEHHWGGPLVVEWNRGAIPRPVHACGWAA